MKKISLFLLGLTFSINVYSQTYNKAYVKALFAKYPVVKSNLGPNDYLWVNPFYKSIADLNRHFPICEYAVVTVAHRVQQETLEATKTETRKGIYESWTTVGVDADVSDVYKYINKQIGKPNTPWEIAYGHCGLCWILAAWCPAGMFFSDAKDFNEGAEYQGQNVGTEIASEDTTRKLIGWKQPPVTQSVQIWAGCYAGPKATTYTQDGVTVTIPDVYWKVLVFNGQTVVYWMPNLPTETVDLLPKRHITYQELVKRLGFNPEQVLHQ